MCGCVSVPFDALMIYVIRRYYEIGMFFMVGSDEIESNERPPRIPRTHGTRSPKRNPFVCVIDCYVSERVFCSPRSTYIKICML